MTHTQSCASGFDDEECEPTGSDRLNTRDDTLRLGREVQVRSESIV